MPTGIINTSSLATDIAKKSFAGAITRLMPGGAAPLFGITSRLASETAVQFEHGFYTKTMLFPSLTLAAAVADGAATVFTVASTTNVVPGMVMRADTTGENMVIDAVISATQVKVSRGIGTVTAIAIADAVNLYQVGTAFEEGSLRPNAVNINPVRITNFTQIFRNTWAITDSARATQVIAGDSNVAESKQDAMAFHAVDIEKALIFGQKSQGTRNGQPFRTMDGFISIVGNISYYPSSYLAANVTTAGATTTLTQLESMIDPAFNQVTDMGGSNSRILFVGGTALRVLNNIGKLNGTYQLTDGQTSYGLQFSTFKLARGSFTVIEHPLFNSNPRWSKMALALDLSTFRVAYLGDRQTQHKSFNADNDATDNGIDAVGGTLTTEMTCVIKNPPANAIIYDLTAAAAG